ncbi:3-hydroxyisobutyrate dehydrogenase-like beta-hydroxyacid dehydrogenase [Nonomuraea thailandensis]|uniref:3-hydroxyisobutyrate dehydrogenase-like beta-hydroxyacid dehydrogenase n=1 Tax=Nonomuraea thailandensis TaxID=1188745 RepID=A0A9X2G9T6_9ACTN|nr:Rid family hydrolase [Nonomuraea thailandensis]MCP2354981.1 3-hydroxyisobutyrate dehydrogenase-like beta-hydroxyacid dehydrogenase [Nonomuraea thailandensis]
MIAFLGQGRMGAPMAWRLVSAGHKVTTWRRSDGVPVTTAVDGADLVITMLSDPAAVREVLTAALPGLRPGATVVEMSTIGPEAVHELRTLLPPEVGLVDAPVLGSVGPAAEGTLTVLAGGDVRGCHEVLSVFGTVRECGPLGSGAAMKIAVMSALVPAQVLLAETFAYGQAHGVDRGALIDVLSGTPLGVLAERLRVPAEQTRYSLAHATKDLELGAWDGATMATAARARLREARAAGLGERDLTAIAEHAAGVRGHRAVPLNLSAIPATNGMYSHAVRVGDMLYVSGQAAFDEHGDIVGEGSMEAQAEHVFQVISRILADQGATFEDIAFIRTYLTDMDDRAAYGRVRRKYITGTAPASTTVEVSKLFMPGLLLEVDLIVALPG